MKATNNIIRTTKIIVVLLIIMSTAKIGFTQNFSTNNERYGVGFSFETSRILNNRMFVEGNYTVGRRTFEIGISPGSYNTNGQGFLFKHKVFLNKKESNNMTFKLKNHEIKTFAIYKFIMFNSTTKTLRRDFDVVEKNPESIIQNAITSPTINTIEHYLGIGAEFRLYNNLSVEAMAVGGVNFIKNNSKAIIIEDKLLPQTNIDISWDISIGVNYRF